MRLYRLCECEGRLDFNAYRALKTEVTIGEALELEAALCVIGDMRAEFSEFYSEFKQREARGDAPGERSDERVEVRALPGPTAAQMGEEIEARTQAAERMERLLKAHRRAVALAASSQDEPAGRMDPVAVRALEQSARSHREAVSYLTKKLG